MPKVSVVIPCYNQGHFILEAIESVLTQTYKDYEIIVVNDGSTDIHTVKILSEINNPKILVLHTQNEGLSSARNTGIKHSVGEYILPLDADDKIGDRYIEKAITIFNTDDSIKIVYCYASFFGVSNDKWILPRFSMEEMLKRNLIFCTALYKRLDFELSGGYNPLMRYGWEDWDLWLTILKDGGKVYRIKETLFFYRKHTISMVGEIEKSEKKRKYLEQQIFSNHTDLYFKYFPEPLTNLRQLDWLKIQSEQFELVKSQIYSSLSYRLGSFLLWPLKRIRNNK